jgi:hypothetical protein
VSKKSRQFEVHEDNYLEASDSFDKLYEREFEKVFDIELPSEDMTVEADGYKMCYFSPIRVGATISNLALKTFAKSYFILHLEQTLGSKDLFLSVNPAVQGKSAFLISKMSKNPDYLNSEMIVVRDSFEFNTSKGQESATGDLDINEYCVTIKVLSHAENSYN